MEIKVGYKNTDIGVIPDDWEVEKFKKVTNAITCGVAATPKYVSETIGKPFLSAQNVQNGQVVLNKYRHITKDLFKQITQYNKPEKGDLLYTRVGAGIGEAAVVELSFDFAVYVSLTLIKPKYNLDSYFLKFILNSTRYKTLAQTGQFAGGGVQNLNVEVVREFKIPLPPLPEQTAIATVLSDTDSLIQALEKKIAKKQFIKKGAMQKLLSQKEGWVVKSLGEIVYFLNGNAHEQFIKTDAKFIVINSKFVSTEGKVFKTSTVNLCPLKKGDVAMVMSDIPNGKALAKCYLVPEDDKYALNQRICCLRAESVDNVFLSLILNRNKYYLAFDSGTGQTNLKRSDVLNCPIPLPPTKQEQTRIAQILSDMDNEIESLKKKLAKYKELKQGLMQVLLTGNIRLV